MPSLLKLITLTYSGIFAEIREAGTANAAEIARDAMFKYEKGDFAGAERLFIDNWGELSSVEQFQRGYLEFLLKTGEYKKILDMRNISGSMNGELLKKAQECLQKLKSNDLQDLTHVIRISPDSLEANAALVKKFLDSGKEGAYKAQPYLKKLEMRYPNAHVVLELQLKSAILLEEMDTLLKALQRLDYSAYNTVSDLFSAIQTVEKINNIDEKLSTFAELYRRAYSISVGTSDRYGLYALLTKILIRHIVKTGCENRKAVGRFAAQLVKLERTETSVYYYIMSLIIEKQLTAAVEEFEKFQHELGPTLKGRIKAELESLRAAFEAQEKAREEQKRRQAEWEQEQKRRAYRQYATKEAGKDFLGHYKTLKVDKNATSEDLKKAQRKRAREIQRETAKRKDLSQDERNELFQKLLKDVNCSYQFLSDPLKKEAYDNGIDPDKAPQFGGHQQGQRFFEEDQFQDLFQSFMGGGRGHHRYQRGRTHFVFL